MNFRRLSREELEELQPQFVRFLAAQGIAADDWTRMKVTEEARVGQLVDQFSELVFDDVTTRITYLEERTATQLFAYRCGKRRIELRGLVFDGTKEDLDFRQNLPPADLMAAVQRSGVGVKLAQAEREYQPDRPTDLFRMLERGALIAKTSELFDLLDGLTKPTNAH